MLFNTVAKLFEDDEVPIFIILNKCDRAKAEVEECLKATSDRCTGATAVIPVVAAAKHGPMLKLCEACDSEEILIMCNARKSFYVCQNSDCQQCDQQQKVKPAYGIEKLFEETTARLPVLVAKSFRQAELECFHDLQHKAHAIIVGFASVAAAAGATPVPFSDFFLLTGIQVAMFTSLAKLFEVQVCPRTAGQLIGSFGGMGAIGVGGRLLGSLMKLIPGFGSAFGGVCNAGLASSLTGAMGFLFKEMFKRIRSKALFGEMTFDDFCQVMNVQEQKEFFMAKFLGLQREPLQQVHLQRRPAHIVNVNVGFYMVLQV